MKKHTIFFLIMTGLMNLQAYGQSSSEVRRSVTLKNNQGYFARTCVIDGEVFSTNNHPYLVEKFCENASNKDSKIVNPLEGSKIAKKANKVDKICCKKRNRYTWRLTRGKSTPSSCINGSEPAADRFCYRSKAIIENKPDGLEYDPLNTSANKKTSIKNKVTNLVSKERASLNDILSQYSKETQAECGAQLNDLKGSTQGKKFKKFVTNSTRSYNSRPASGYVSQNIPICCQTGSGETTVVANSCACQFNSSLASDGKTRLPAKAVVPTKYHCPDLYKAIKNIPKDIEIESKSKEITAQEEEFLKKQLEDFLKGNKNCRVTNRASLPLSKVCASSEKDEYYFLDITCGKKTTQAICHEFLKNGRHKAREIQAKDCHTEG